ncbi:hypothetical protein DPMN_071318 [Dreissena polymorpha]|uniref:Reverse transcriptase n=1 Tax=Dreissena polymorpha TaxID=45954 RepID=A0A9D4BW71_DREPO|nr:hypothetical protein DPMN_071318 [Dreissena polymorpha]
MDDLTITTESHIQARWILSALGDIVSWAKMAFRPRKSIFLILRRGKVWQKIILRVQDRISHHLLTTPSSAWLNGLTPHWVIAETTQRASGSK